jgi:ubiquinone/menaquinone biosynthesis C-methylase UbiE
MTNAPSLEPIIRHATAYWATGILGTAVVHSLFTHIEGGATTLPLLSERAGLSERGAQAMLDGLTGLGLLSLEGGHYRNTPEASAYLVEGKPTYFGDFVRVNFKTMPKWVGLPDAAKSGGSVLALSGVPDAAYWDELVIAIAPLSLPVARQAAEELRIADAGPCAVLDVAGGAGAFSAVFLAANAKASATQIDWSNVNRIARGFVAGVAGAGATPRFKTIDGEFLKTDYGTDAFDFAVYSHMAHGVTPEENLAALDKLRRALKPGGTLIINEFVVNDDGTAMPFILTFSANILFHSSGGRGWREGEYRKWLAHTGFTNVRFQPTNTPATLIYAERPRA